MGASVLLTFPKDPYGPVKPGPQKTNELGLEKFGWLKELKNSVRNWSRKRSVIMNCLKRLRSTIWIPGPWNLFGAQVPKVPGAGTANDAGCTKALLVVKSWWSVLVPEKGVPVQSAYSRKACCPEGAQEFPAPANVSTVVTVFKLA